MDRQKYCFGIDMIKIESNRFQEYIRWNLVYLKEQTNKHTQKQMKQNEQMQKIKRARKYTI